MVVEKELEGLKRKLRLVEQERDHLISQRDHLTCLEGNVEGEHEHVVLRKAYNLSLAEASAPSSVNHPSNDAGETWRKTICRTHKSNAFAVPQTENFEEFLPLLDTFPTRDLNSGVHTRRRQKPRTFSSEKLFKKKHFCSEAKNFDNHSSVTERSERNRNQTTASEDPFTSRKSRNTRTALTGSFETPLEGSQATTDEKFTNTESQSRRKIPEARYSTIVEQSPNYSEKVETNSVLSANRASSVFPGYSGEDELKPNAAHTSTLLKESAHDAVKQSPQGKLTSWF